MNKKCCTHKGFLASYMKFCGGCGKMLNKKIEIKTDCIEQHEGFHFVGKHNFCPLCGRDIKIQFAIMA